MTGENEGDGGGTGDAHVIGRSAVHEVHGDEVHGDEGIVSRISLVEDQPLGDRAAAFAQVVDELRAHLEGADGDARRFGA